MEFDIIRQRLFQPYEHAKPIHKVELTWNELVATSTAHAPRSVGQSSRRFDDEIQSYFVEGEIYHEGLRELTEHAGILDPHLWNNVLPRHEFAHKAILGVAGGAYIPGLDPNIPTQFRIKRKTTQLTTGARLIKLVFNTILPWFESKETIFTNAALLYYLVEHLNACGYEVEIELQCNLECDMPDYNTISHRIMLKEYGEYLNTHNLALICGEFFMRGLIFRNLEHIKDFTARNGCYGYVRRLDQKMEIGVIPIDLYRVQANMRATYLLDVFRVYADLCRGVLDEDGKSTEAQDE